MVTDSRQMASVIGACKTARLGEKSRLADIVRRREDGLYW